METSIIVPMFNEATRLPRTLPRLLELADRPSIEIIVVDDGSDDGSCDLLAAHRSHPRIRVHRQLRNRGKGAAVRRGVQSSRGGSVVFMDADLATDLGSLGPLLAALGESDVAIGSRAHEGSVLHDTTRGRSRRGGRFNQMVRRLTGLPFRDTQCGFKAFTAPAAKALFSLGRIDGFAFDVEILMLARAHGLRITEVPVEWTEVRGSKVRPIADPIRMAGDVMRASVSSSASRRSRVAGLELVAARGNVAALAAAVQSNVRAGDLVSHDGVTVRVALPFASTAERVVSRLSAVDDIRRAAVSIQPMVLRLPEILRERPLQPRAVDDLLAPARIDGALSNRLGFRA